MSYNDLVSEIKQLSMNERLELLEILVHSLQEDLSPAKPVHEGSALERVRGILKPDGPMPTDEDVKDAYAEYLAEKYA